MLDTKQVEIIILELGSEDRYGLHEVLWALNARYPDVPDNQKLSAARQAVSSLLGRGRLTLYRQRWAEMDSTSPLDEAQAIRVLEDPGSWAPGDDLVTFEVTSTAGGAA
jgi:hypothetical protein